MKTLRVEGLAAGYSEIPVVRDVTIEAGGGSTVCVLGPNGSGKSTLLKAIVGLLKVTAGRVAVSGNDVTGLPVHEVVRQGVGYVPQSKNVFPSLSVVENLEMGAFVRDGVVDGLVEEVLDKFPDLKDARKKAAGNLSGGQKNLLGLARALMLDPAVILVDEPTAGLSPSNAARIWQQLSAIAAAGTSVVVVEQNADVALEHSDWCYVLVAGTVRLSSVARSVAPEVLTELFLGGVTSDFSVV
jgi:ABC-type branched-subunit amino acid transport system ATPase component